MGQAAPPRERSAFRRPPAHSRQESQRSRPPPPPGSRTHRIRSPRSRWPAPCCPSRMPPECRTIRTELPPINIPAVFPDTSSAPRSSRRPDLFPGTGSPGLSPRRLSPFQGTRRPTSRTQRQARPRSQPPPAPYTPTGMLPCAHSCHAKDSRSSHSTSPGSS